MIFTYEFGGDDYRSGEMFEYEVEYEKVKKALVKILCSQSKHINKDLYNEDGNYQMAMFIVYKTDVLDSLTEYYEEELEEYFYNEAYEKFKEVLEDEREQEDWYGTICDIQ